MFASDVGVHVLDVDAGLLRDQEAQTGGVEVGAGAEDLVGSGRPEIFWATWVAMSTGLVMSM